MWLKSGLVVLGLVALVVLFFPLPHGGSIGIAIIRELSDAIVESPENGNVQDDLFHNTAKKEKLYKKLSGRFKASIDVGDAMFLAKWPKLEIFDSPAWLDENSGLIWGARQKLTFDSWGNEQLESAISYCQKLYPEGYWSLPTHSEFALAIKHKIQDHIEDIRGMWIAPSYSSDFPGFDPMPTVVGFSNQGINQFSVRCVARTGKAPVHGYIRDDITNADVLGMINR